MWIVCEQTIHMKCPVFHMKSQVLFVFLNKRRKLKKLSSAANIWRYFQGQATDPIAPILSLKIYFTLYYVNNIIVPLS